MSAAETQVAGAGQLRVLHVGSEIYPFVKTGGLADVLAALPPALARQGAEVRLLLPGYPAILRRLEGSSVVSVFGPAFGAATLAVRLGRLPGIELPVYVLDSPYLFNREGNPYVQADGRDWPDNPQRFGALSWVAAHLGFGDIDWRWRAQLVHAHDWHAGLACAYLAQHPASPARSVFTVHNLAFGGLFEPEALGSLMLPPAAFGLEGVEFHRKGSAMKAGLQFADRITTVSPSYAAEIQSAEFGCGLEGVLSHRAARLHGILNGVDYSVWNPAADGYLEHPFEAGNLAGKQEAKAALQAEMGLSVNPKAMLLGVVSRLTPQKGSDLLLDSASELAADGDQLVILGAGDRPLEEQASRLAAAFPRSIAVKIGYDERLAHRIVAGSDVLAMPSRFEPCGLTQLYALRYGTLPLVRRVGGLADTVVNTDTATLLEDRATGFSFEAANATALIGTVRRARHLFDGAPGTWSTMQNRAMAQNFSWDTAAKAYMALYQDLVPAGATPAGGAA